MDDLDYIKLQLELECIGFNKEGLLERIAGENPDGIGLLYLFRLTNGQFRLLFRADVPAQTRRQISDLDPSNIFAHPEQAEAILQAALLTGGINRFKGYTFKFQPLPHQSAEKLPWKMTAWGLYEDGELASYCMSARENSRSAEAWVETQPEYRRKGLAQKAVFGWAADIQDQKKVPFYSHLVSNEASAALAKKMGLAMFAECVCVGGEGD
jgi:hypothetical protein